MDLKTKIAGIVVAILALFGIYSGGHTLSSVEQGNSYSATTTYSKLGTPLFGVSQTLVGGTVALTPGTLGSVVITGAVAGAMKFMDATSTTDISSTTIAVFPASTAANTYTLDLNFYRGLIVETTAALTPTTTITYRPY